MKSNIQDINTAPEFDYANKLYSMKFLPGPNNQLQMRLRIF